MANLQYYLKEVEKIFSNENFIFEPELLYGPIDYTLRLGGKRIRPTLLLAANAMFGGNEKQAHDAALGIETFHNFTLLHDDLMDKSPLRRGKTTVYRKWDENTAVLSGDTMYALAWRYFLRQPAPNLQQILQCFCETAIEVCEGQRYDMDFEHCLNVKIDDYMMMIRKKTAVLLAGALKIGALYANAKPSEVDKLYDFGIHIGLAFQLQDDLLDCYGDTAIFGKKTCQDIRDNKKTYLPLRAMTMCTENQANELKKIFTVGASIEEEEEKIVRTKAIYNAIGLRKVVDEEIAKEFVISRELLDDIDLPEEKKLPLREMMETLDGRKK